MKNVILSSAFFLVIVSGSVISCQKTALPEQRSVIQSAGSSDKPQARMNSWNTLFYFGTPDYNGGCHRPCGMCHASPLLIGYQPPAGSPDNNEALAVLAVQNSNSLILSVNLDGLDPFYINDILNTGEFTVANATELPHDVVVEVCNAANIPVWPGSVVVFPGIYQVEIESTANDARLEMEGSYDAASGWSWKFFVR